MTQPLDLHARNMGGQITLGTPMDSWRLALPAMTANDTDFADVKDWTSTEPATDATNGRAVIPTGSANFIRIKPFGSDTANQTMILSVFAWRVAQPDPARAVIAGQGLWVATLLAKVTLTLGTADLGSDADLVPTSLLRCDTASVTEDRTTGGLGVMQSKASSPDNTEVTVEMDLRGAPVVELDFDCDDSAATCNALYTFL